jgi:hydroxymethylbilane synthase
MKLKMGSRGSKLALWQTNWIKDLINENDPGIEIEIEVIHTEGDKILDISLSQVGDKGFFTKEIENSLLDGAIDLAVHSLKDLPTQLPPGLTIGAITPRADARDVLISKNKVLFADLPKGAQLATGSLRRAAQLAQLRPDLIFHDIRGNVETRIQKFQEKGWDGLVLAGAGIQRLNLTETITEWFSVDIMLPAVGQGALVIEIREGNEKVIDVIQFLNHKQTYQATLAERAFLRRLQGGCQIPIGAYAQISNDTVRLQGLVASLNGKHVLKDELTGKSSDAEKVGVKLAEKLIANGAEEILKEIR